MSAPKITNEERIRRFWSRVQKSTTSTCWLWTGARSGRNGYGQTRVGKAMRGAHVVAYQLQCGPTSSLQVLHTCDNKLCVRPDHLFLGTQLDNMRDKVTKGRQARGVKNGASKLSEAALLDIFTQLAAGGRGVQTRLARKYKVHKSCISLIATGKKHVEGRAAFVRAAAAARGDHRS